MHSVVIRKVLIRNGTSKVSSSIWSREDLAASWLSGRQLVTYAKVAMHANGVYMEKNGNELVRKAWWGCQLSCKMQKDANFQLQTYFFSYIKTCRARNGAFKARNGAFKAWNASFEPNATQALSKRDQLGVLINGVVDHFMRKVKEDGMLVIAGSVEKSARDWNNISKPEDNSDEVCEEENCCLAWAVLLHFLYFAFGMA